MPPRLQDGPDRSGSGNPDLTSIVGRLRATPARAKAELLSWARGITGDRPEDDRAAAAELFSLATATRVSPEALVVLAPIMAAFALVLAIACANVANMMLARGMARQREIGIRLSLGAARGRLMRNLLP